MITCCKALTGISSAAPVAASCHQLPQIAGIMQSWVASDESMLKRILSLNLSKCYGARIIADEWTPKPGLFHLGRGDLVAELPCGTHLVVELKHLNFVRTGHNQRVMRRKLRREVEEQTIRYGRLWQERLRDQGDFRPVICASYTNEEGLKHFGDPSAMPAEALSALKAVDSPELRPAAPVAALKNEKTSIDSSSGRVAAVMHAH